jgi:hypothetical protein
LDRLIHQAARLALHLPQGPRAFAQHVEVVVLRRHRVVAGGLPLVVDDVQALGQAPAAVLSRLPQLRQLAEFLGPFLAHAALGEPAADPTQAVLLDDPQARPLAEEDFVGGGLRDAGAAELVEDGQQGGTALAGLLGQPAQLRHAGRLPRGGRGGGGPGQDHGQQAAADRQADALGLGGAGKGGQAVVVADEGVGADALQLGDAAAQGSAVVTELLELLSAVVAAEGGQQCGGVAVEGLAGESVLAGTAGNGAVGPGEGGGGIGDAGLGGKLSTG